MRQIMFILEIEQKTANHLDLIILIVTVLLFTYVLNNILLNEL